MSTMAVTAKKLDVKIGDVVEIEGRRYDVVSDQEGGVTLEPAITQTVAEIHAAHGGRALSAEEFEELFGDLPTDDDE
jgi:anaerobic selenocysteine-containing dehydrogenase